MFNELYGKILGVGNTLHIIDSTVCHSTEVSGSCPPPPKILNLVRAIDIPQTIGPFLSDSNPLLNKQYSRRNHG